MCLEVDGYEFHDRQAQTHSSVRSLNPHWDQVGLRTHAGTFTLCRVLLILPSFRILFQSPVFDAEMLQSSQCQCLNCCFPRKRPNFTVFEALSDPERTPGNLR